MLYIYIGNMEKVQKIVKILIVGLLLLISIMTNAQSRLGFSEQEIRSEFSDETFYSGRTEDGTKYIYKFGGHTVAFYYFDEDNVTYMCSVMPKESGALNYLVEHYNKTAVIVDNYNWKSYGIDNHLTYISLREVNNKLVFIYTVRPLE